MLKVKFKKLNDSTKLPYKGSLNAACYDVYAHSITFKDGKAVYGLGFSTEIPVGYRGVIVPRSNLSKHQWMLGNSMGIIDADYRGEWMIVFKCLGEMIYNPLPYGIGDRCGQLYFEPVQGFYMEEVDELSDTERGEGGFGSTGK
jgi:dUTP pyrophosphatase